MLAHSVDYAGLFPPATLALEPALRNHAEYVRNQDEWMLGAFVLPIAEFDAAARGLASFDSEHLLRISVLGARTTDAAAFIRSLAATEESIRLFRTSCGDRVAIDQLEAPFPGEMNPDALNETRTALSGLRLNVFLETPAETAVRSIETIAQNNGAHSGRKLCFKLRTGGVTSDAFPSSAQIAAALVAATQHQVPIKFTAGLHHPVRLYHESVQTKMHGFLNVLGAGVLAAERNWSGEQTARMLDDEEP
ncbi:MAG: hypothetical protein DLM73_02780, partial [Chthoniobacterales bacterium]